MPWREMEWHAAVEVFVAQHPADAARPRQHAKGGRVGNDSEIGRARHLVETHPAAARERGEGAGIGGIEGSSGDVDVVAGLERGTEHRNSHRFGACSAMWIGPCKAHQFEMVLLDFALELLGLPSLLLGPEAVPCDECEGLFHLHLPCDAGRGPQSRLWRFGDPDCGAVPPFKSAVSPFKSNVQQNSAALPARGRRAIGATS